MTGPHADTISPAVSLADQLADAEREAHMRRRLYPGWVKAGKMTQAQADRQIAAMEAIAKTLRSLQQPPAPPAQGSLLG